VKTILVGSRGSTLALAQAKLVVESLKKHAPTRQYRIVPIKTSGDTMHEKAEASADNKSLFTKEIEDSLLNGEVDVAVHSMKDLTADLPKGLAITAVPQRADHRDALISRSKQKFEKLPGGARMGTSSPRRKTQLLAARSDLQIVEMHGNVDTRLRKLRSGQCDAIILAAAGLDRLGLERQVTELLSTEIMLPAVGQGALAVQSRESDDEIRDLLIHVEHTPTRRAIEAERAFARRLGANCRTPIAAYAKTIGAKLSIDGLVGSLDGRKLMRSRLVSDNTDASKVGEELADSLIKQGAQLVLEAQ
jgi:hydroxymethylbilane synthase